MGFLSVTRDSWSRFLTNNDFNLSAALAFYMILSIVPFFALIFIIAGIFIDVDFVSNSILVLIGDYGSPRIADIFETVIMNSQNYQGMNAASIIGLIFLFISATALVSHIHFGLNKIWRIKPKKLTSKRKILKSITKKRLKALLIIILGVILLVFFFFISLIINYMGSIYGFYIKYLNLLIWFVFMTFIFSFLFKFLPDKRPSFRKVIFGSVVTAIFFVVGQILLGIYFLFVDVGSVFGALGGLVVLLVWLYYSAAVFFFGAEFTYLTLKDTYNN